MGDGFCCSLGLSGETHKTSNYIRFFTFLCCLISYMPKPDTLHQLSVLYVEAALSFLLRVQVEIEHLGNMAKTSHNIQATNDWVRFFPCNTPFMFA